MTHRNRKTGLALSRRSVLGGIGAASAMAITGLPVRAQTLTPGEWTEHGGRRR